MTGPVLVAGVGNVFLGDDGFGPAVAARLAAEPLPGVEVVDYGIRGLHLAFRLLEPVRLLAIADLVQRGGPPGTLYRLEPELEPGWQAGAAAEAHGMDLPAVFASVRAMGGALPRVVIVGCEPAHLGERMGLSPAVSAAVAPAARMLREVAERALAAAGAAEETT